MRDPTLGPLIKGNPADFARPKCPKPYQTESSKALDDEQVGALVRVVMGRAEAGDVVGKRILLRELPLSYNQPLTFFQQAIVGFS